MRMRAQFTHAASGGLSLESYMLGMWKPRKVLPMFQAACNRILSRVLHRFSQFMKTIAGHENSLG